MADLDPSDADPDPMQSTAEVIEAARRPLIVARHRDAVQAALSDIDDTVLMSLDGVADDAQDLLSTIAEDDSLHTATLAEGILERACIAREHGELNNESATTILAGVYRLVRDALSAHQGDRVSELSDLNTLPCGRLQRLFNPAAEIAFGSLGLADALVYTVSQGERCRASLRVIAKAEEADPHWSEAAGEPSLSREQEEPLEHLPETERRAARAHLVRDRIRHRFFKKVFLVYFDRDSLDPDEIAAHGTILDWLNSIADTPHLYPFMQGQTQGQKIFRLRQLWRKIIQLNEVYQRVAQAANHPSYRERFVDLNTRQRLAILAEERYPALKVDTSFSIATAMCPFHNFALWVQDKVTSKDFVLPPEPKGGL